MPALLAIARKCYIVAHTEDVTQLASVLEQQGFTVEVVRGPYSPEQERFSTQIKCLLNHGNVWRKIIRNQECAIVLEADFVPVVRFAKLPLPCPSPEQCPAGMFAYLYTCGPIIYGADLHERVFGHSAATVAYTLDHRTAKHLVEFERGVLDLNPEGKYSPWDTQLGVYIRKQCGILNYFPLLSYGEHGGTSNIEHSDRQYRRSWHHAETLKDSLAFYPGYSRNSLPRLFQKRLVSWVWGVGRLLLGRTFDPRYVNREANQVSRARLFILAATRIFSGRRIGHPKLT